MTYRVGSLLLLGMTAAACASQAPRAAVPEGTPVEATVARVEAVDLPSSFEAGGVLRARSTATLSSRILAPVVEVRVRPGDRVTRGQVLVVLDARDLHAQAARAQASLEAARQTARASETDVQAADAGLTLARAVHDRMSALHAKRSATSQELDDAVAGWRAAEARHAGAQANVQAAAAALAAAGAASDGAKVASTYASIAAPFDGLVAARHVDPGTVAAPGMPLLTLEDTGTFHLEVRLDDARAALVAVNQPAQVRLDSAGQDAERWTAGQVVEIARLDPASHSFMAKVELPPGASLRSGLFGRARFGGPSRQALAVPASAVVRRGQLSLVFVAADGVARLRAVTTGPTAADHVEILAGLSSGESVVITPPASLADGALLKPAVAADTTPTTGVRQ